MAESKHECPVEGCTKQLPSHILMCKPHWFSVPKDLRDAVYAAYQGGAGLFTEEYKEARDAAIAAAEMAEGKDG